MYKTITIKPNYNLCFNKSRRFTNGCLKTQKISEKTVTIGSRVYMYNIGELRHYPPAVREWKNSVYSYNKHNQAQHLSRYILLDRLLRGYFNINNNTWLARSKRMRYLRVKSTSKRVYISKPEVKQTSDGINITVYYYDKKANNFSRKLFFYNRPKIANSLIRVNKSRKKINKLGMRTTNTNNRIAYSGLRYIKELRTLKRRNQHTTLYIQQKLLLHFFKYIFGMLNVHIYTPTSLHDNLIFFMKRYRIKIWKNNWRFGEVRRQNYQTLLEKEFRKLDDLIKRSPDSILWIDHNSFMLDKIEKSNINAGYLREKLIKHYKDSFNNIDKHVFKNVNTITKPNSEVNTKLWGIISSFLTRNTYSYNIMMKTLNFLTLKLNRFITKKILGRRNRRIYRLISLNHNNLIKMKKLLPALKLSVDSLFNKKAVLNIVNLKYFYLDNDIYNKAIITKFRKRGNPLKILNRSVSNMKIFLGRNFEEEIKLNNIDRLYSYNNLSLMKLPYNLTERRKSLLTKRKRIAEDRLQSMFNLLYPSKYMYEYSNVVTRGKINSVLRGIKYRKMLGIRIEARGRLTRRNTAARAKSLLVYKGNLKDINIYKEARTGMMLRMSALLLRNSQRPNTKFVYSSSKRRIGAFGLKTWISGK